MPLCPQNILTILLFWLLSLIQTVIAFSFKMYLENKLVVYDFILLENDAKWITIQSPGSVWEADVNALCVKW